MAVRQKGRDGRGIDEMHWHGLVAVTEEGAGGAYRGAPAGVELQAGRLIYRVPA